MSSSHPKADIKSIFPSSSPLSSAAAPPQPQPSEDEESLPPPAADSSSSLTTSVEDFLMDSGGLSSLTTTTVEDFLMESGGLSYVQALQVIREKPTLLQDGGRKARLVIAYFESIGFSKTHIAKLISRLPRVLVSDVEKTLKPKIQLFIDFGFSKSNIADLMSSRPTIMRTGVNTQMRPGLDLIKSFVKTDDVLIKIIKRHGLVLVANIWRKSIEPNIDVLRQHGVPDSEIVHMVGIHLSSLMSTPKVFIGVVERIVSLGFKPKTKKFLTAVAIMSGMKKATWDSKIHLLKGLGWSEVQILDAFRRLPVFLVHSTERMKKGLEFFKESLNWGASVVSQCPFVLNYSLKRRVIPRYAVFKCLKSEEIIEEDKVVKVFIYILKVPEEKFLSKYVFKYQEQLPYLYEVYNKECMLGCEKDNGDIDMTV